MKNKRINLLDPDFKGKEAKYLDDCVKSGWISSGKYIDLFEKKISDYTNSKYSIACVNGTSALQVSLRLSGVKPNDEVIVPSITFIAPINAVLYNGASPIFMDSDDFYNLDQYKTIEFIKKETYFKNKSTYNKKTNKRISAMIGVHVFGNALNFENLYSFCKKRNIEIIEDASESIGTFYTRGSFKSKHTGTIAKIGCLSFNGNKMISCGGGGMILTNNKLLAKKARYLISQAKNDSKRYVHDEVGYNFRMSNIHAAIGLAQMEKIDYFIKRKKLIYKYYSENILNIEGLSLLDPPEYSTNNHWLNVIRINKKIFKKDSIQMMNKLQKIGIETRAVWKPNHLQKPFKNYQNYKLENCTKLVNSSLCIPSSTNLSTLELLKIIRNLKNN